MRAFPRALVSMLLGCAAAAVVAQPPLDLATAEVVDLSHPFDEHTIYWPNSPSSFELERLAWGQTAGGFFYSSNALCTPEHGGTHLDAPIHFAAGRRTVDQLPLRQLIAPAVVLDVSGQAAADADYRLSRADVEAWEKAHGLVPEGAIVLLRTGWSARWPDRKRYLGDDRPGVTTDLHFPAFGPEATELLVQERKVGALGVDTASLDHGPSRDFLVHRIAAEADVAGLENLTALERLPPTGAWVIALPMKVAGGSGGPVRVVALLPTALAKP